MLDLFIVVIYEFSQLTNSRVADSTMVPKLMVLRQDACVGCLQAASS